MVPAPVSPRASAHHDLARKIAALPVGGPAGAAPGAEGHVAGAPRGSGAPTPGRAASPAGPSADPCRWVQTLVVEGLLLGTYERVHDFDDDEWEGLLEALSRYGGPETPRSGRPSPSVSLDDLFRDPDRPIMDAVLAIALAEGLGALTLERVAEVSERSLSFLVSAFGSVDELLHDVVEQAYGDGFDDLSPLRDDVCAQTVTQYLAVFESPRQVAAVWRVLVLTGVAAPPEVRARLGADHRALRSALPSPAEDPGAWLVPLALDGWVLGSTTEGYAWMDRVPAGVPEELARLLQEQAV